MEKELRILMIEDVPTDAELEIRELKRAGLRVTHRIVETEGAFREALRDFQPELIISDFAMPHFDGMWALALSRELAPDVPFLFVSGTIGEEYAIRALKNGATDYVLKNNLVRLPSAVERALREQAERAVRRRAEEEIKHQRAFLRQVIDLDRNIIFARDREGRFTLVNQALADFYGCTVEYPLGGTYADINPNSEQAEQIRKVDLEVMNTLREVFIPEEQITDAAGRVHWHQVVKRPLISADGKANMVLGVATDITERKLQELKIARLNRVLLVLSGINSAIVRIRDREELFKEACRIAVEHGGFGIAWIGMLDSKTLEIIPAACAGVEADSLLARSRNTARPDLPQGQGVVGRAIREKRAVFSNDLLTEPIAGGERRKEAIRRGYRSVIALPLLVENTTMGSLSLFAKEPNFFDDEEIKLLTELAGDISFALEHIAKEEKLEKLSRIRAVSGGINAAIVRIRERETLLRETCRIVAEHGKFELVWVALLDQEKQQVLPVAWTGFSPEAAHAVSWASISAARGTLGEAIQTRKAAVRNDLEAELTSGKLRQEALKAGCRSTVCLPLVVDDRVAALIVLFATGLGFFDEDELALLDELAADVSFALQSTSRQEKLEYLSYYDALTGLPNRTLFNDRLEQRVSAARHDRKTFAVMMMDLERFRNVNETLGRTASDDLLRQVGQRLKNALEETGILAHIGGDHFAIAARHADEGGNVAHFLEKILTTVLGQPFEAGDNELRLAARAGVAVYPEDGTGAESLLRNAEAALNKAKASGERYLFYQPKMNAAVAQTLLLENRLRQALEKEQFVLHYQPKVDLAKGTLIGLEALIRWNDPETGLVPPMQFIPLLEETGMILEVGRWAIRKALEDYREWCARGLQPPCIAVNVSPIQLRQKNFVDVVRDAIGESPAGFHGLDLEITESLIMEDIEGNIEKLRAVRDMGVNVAIDDFGTGYSSLRYLAMLPVNALKIDRSFIITMANNADNMTIVSTIISLAHSLNLKVIAEGVDSEEQRTLLKLLKCDEMQGYLFSRPLPAAEVEAKYLAAAAA